MLFWRVLCLRVLVLDKTSFDGFDGRALWEIVVFTWTSKDVMGMFSCCDDDGSCFVSFRFVFKDGGLWELFLENSWRLVMYKMGFFVPV